MDSLVEALIKQGWLSTVIVILGLVGAVKIGEILLKREWARGDRQDAVITQLSGTTEKVLVATDKMSTATERLLDGQQRFENRLDRLEDLLRQQQPRAG